MKKKQILCLLACSIVLVGNIQAGDFNDMNNQWQNTNSLPRAQTSSTANDLNTEVNTPTSGLIILVIAGFAGLFFAKKHHDLAKKHQDFVNRH